MSHAPAAHPQAPSHPHVPALKMGVPIPNGKLGMWLFLGTEIMFFTAFIGTYIVLRLGSKGWPANPEVTHIRIWAGGLNTFVLITSSVFVVLAHEAMGLKKYKLATNWIIATTLLAFVFLAIKSYEYYGKWDHDILPGHVAESPQQAIDKLARELDQATGLAELQQEQTKIDNAIIRAASKPENEAQSKVLASQRHDVEARMSRLGPVLAAYRDRPKVAKGQPEQASFREKLKSGKMTVHEAEEELHQLRAEKLPKLVDDKHKELKELEDPAATNTKSVSPEDLKKLKADKAAELRQLQASVRAFAGVHEPHYIKWGNTFASIYFLMTGFHALHVVLGMVMFAIIIWLGLAQQLGPQHALVVENFGLYWHFVDLVWIFLFPLIYIV
jgi:cytochrome c oxidase subunit 3